MHPTRVKNLLKAKQDGAELLRAASDRLRDGCEYPLAMNVDSIVASAEFKINDFIQTHLPIVERKN